MSMNRQIQFQEAYIRHEYDLSVIHSFVRSVQPPNRRPVGLNLANPNGVANTQPPNLELNLMRGYREINNGVPHIPTVPNRRTFACNFCTKQFGNGQALGGHQRAHTLERAFHNWQLIRLNRFGSRPGYGVPRNPLGVNALSSMIHKPVGSVGGAVGYTAPMIHGPVGSVGLAVGAVGYRGSMIHRPVGPVGGAVGYRGSMIHRPVGPVGGAVGYRASMMHRPVEAVGGAVGYRASMMHRPVGSVVGAVGYRARGFERSFPVMPGPIPRPWAYSRLRNPMNNNGASSSSNQEIIDLMAHDGTDGTPPPPATE